MPSFGITKNVASMESRAAFIPKINCYYGKLDNSGNGMDYIWVTIGECGEKDECAAIGERTDKGRH